jgi:hypothetical protein
MILNLNLCMIHFKLFSLPFSFLIIIPGQFILKCNGIFCLSNVDIVAPFMVYI